MDGWVFFCCLTSSCSNNSICNLQSELKKCNVCLQVLDKDGNDVTPQPLHAVKRLAKAVPQRHKSSRFLDEISVALASEMSGESVCSMPFSR